MSVQVGAISPQPTRDEECCAFALRQGRRERQARAAHVRRGQLLEVAWQLLQEQGPARFNMRELGLRAGYTAGAMYGYFASREHILLALRQRWVDEVAIAVARAKLSRRLRRSASATPSTRLATSQELDTAAAAAGAPSGGARNGGRHGRRAWRSRAGGLDAA